MTNKNDISTLVTTSGRTLAEEMLRWNRAIEPAEEFGGVFAQLLN